MCRVPAEKTFIQRIARPHSENACSPAAASSPAPCCTPDKTIPSASPNRFFLPGIVPGTIPATPSRSLSQSAPGIRQTARAYPPLEVRRPGGRRSHTPSPRAPSRHSVQGCTMHTARGNCPCRSAHTRYSVLQGIPAVLSYCFLSL